MIGVPSLHWGAADDFSTGSSTCLSASAGFSSTELVFELALRALGFGWVVGGGPELRLRFSREVFEPGWDCYKPNPNPNLSQPQSQIKAKRGRGGTYRWLDVNR